MARNTENLRFFKDGCWNKEHSPANSTIFVDLRVSINFGISNRKRCLIFCSYILFFKMSRGSHTAPMAKKPGKSKIFQGWLLEKEGQIRWFSWICGSSLYSALLMGKIGI